MDPKTNSIPEPGKVTKIIASLEKEKGVRA